MSRDPLHRFPGVRATKRDEFERILVERYGAKKLDVLDPEGLNARGNWIQLRDIALGFSACSAPAAVSFDPCDFVRLQLPLRGQGTTSCARTVTHLDAEHPCLTSARRPVTFQYGRDFEHFVLRVSDAAIRARLELLLDTPIQGEVEFSPSEFAGNTGILVLRRLIETIACSLDDEASLISPLALAELEAALVLQLLLASRHTFSALLEREARSAAPACVKRVEAHIEQNWHRPVTMEELVRTGGVSERSLYKSFQQSRGYTPMQFLKQVRLDRARDLLRSDRDGRSVAGIAFAAGFLSTNHFAREYHRAFGELPSRTLEGSRKPQPFKTGRTR